MSLAGLLHVVFQILSDSFRVFLLRSRDFDVISCSSAHAPAPNPTVLPSDDEASPAGRLGHGGPSDCEFRKVRSPVFNSASESCCDML